jgi:hypothetical protein
MVQPSSNRRTGRQSPSPRTNKTAPDTDQALVSRFGPFEIDWPRSFGYFGGAALAVGVGLIDPPVGLFIAAVPFLKMLNLPRAPTPTKFIGQVIEGMAKPVGGDSQGTVRISSRSAGANDKPVGQGS